jgi:long-chain acyl-CoA synthetase
MLDWWGDSIYEYYAATEGGGTIVTPEQWREHPGTVGTAWANSGIRIFDDECKEVPRGEQGTVYMLLGETGTFEYKGDAEKTRENRISTDDGLVFFSVGDVAVFGIPHDNWGEEIKAVVEPTEGVVPGDALTEDLLAFCKDKLARFKTPKSIDYTHELPRDPNGKLYKRKLRDPYWEGRERAI